GVGEDRALHFDGRNIFAAADDDVLLAVDDVDVSLLIPDSHVAGVQPAARHHSGGGFRLLIITVHHQVAANHNFADRLHVARNIVHLAVHHANLAARNRPPGVCQVTQA